jgi:hypothetical protein
MSEVIIDSVDFIKNNNGTSVYIGKDRLSIRVARINSTFITHPLVSLIFATFVLNHHIFLSRRKLSPEQVRSQYSIELTNQ